MRYSLIVLNETIQFGSVLFMRCIGINKNYTMSIPLAILKTMGADFDGKSIAPYYSNIVSEFYRIAGKC